MPALSAAQQYGGDVNALRSWASFDAELQTFATGSLFCDIARQFSGERQVATDLANDQRSAQMASVNLDVTTGFLVDNPDRYQVFQSRRCEAATARRQRATPLTSVDKRGRNRVDCRFVGPFWRTVRASLDDDGDLQIEPKDKQTCVEYKLHKKRSGARTQRQRGTKARDRFKEPAHLLTLQEAIKRDSQVQKKKEIRGKENQATGTRLVVFSFRNKRCQVCRHVKGIVQKAFCVAKHVHKNIRKGNDRSQSRPNPTTTQYFFLFFFNG